MDAWVVGCSFLVEVFVRASSHVLEWVPAPDEPDSVDAQPSLEDSCWWVLFV